MGQRQSDENSLFQNALDNLTDGRSFKIITIDYRITNYVKFNVLVINVITKSGNKYINHWHVNDPAATHRNETFTYDQIINIFKDKNIQSIEL